MTQEQVPSHHDALLDRLRHAEDTLDAIRRGEADALVVSGPHGERAYTLTSAEQPYRLMIEQMSEGALTTMPDGTILYANRTFARLVGRPLQQVIGSALADYVAASERSAFADTIDAATRGHGRGEFHLVTADGAKVPVFVSASPITFSQVPTVSVIVTDLTLQRHHEELRQSEERFRLLSETLEQRVAQRTAEAERRANQLRYLTSELTHAENRERRRLAEMIHDHLQQFLVAAKMRVAIIQRHAVDPKVLDAVEEVDELLQQSIDASRSLTIELRPPVLYEDGLIAAIRWLAGWMQKKHGLHVMVHSQPGAEPKDEDVAVLLYQVVRELLFNVVKYATVSVAHVDLRLGDGGNLELTVSDEGAGFDCDNVKTGRGESGGFGLFSIRERLQVLGGSLQVDSLVGRGTTVRVMVPVGPPMAREESADELGGTAGRRRTAPPPKGNRIRVMLADDHGIVRQGIAAMLAEVDDIEVVGEASDGVEAITMMRQLRPDVVVMDVNMPRMNGIEATRRITQEYPEANIIGLSVQEESGTTESFLDAGAREYLSKDGPSEALIAAIRRSMSKSRDTGRPARITSPAVPRPEPAQRLHG